MHSKTAIQTSILFFLLIITSACATVTDADPGVKDGPVAILGTLSGDLPTAALKKLPEGIQQQSVGYFSSQKQLDAVLPAILAGDRTLPAVDFSSQIVLFTKNTQFYNRLRIGQVLREGETLTVLAMETMSAMPITDKVAISFAIIERDGARFIAAREGNIAIVD